MHGLKFFLNPHARICLLILDREEMGEERESDTDVRERLPPTQSPNWGSILQPRHVPHQGIKPVAFGVRDDALPS